MSELRAATISNLAGTGPVELTGQVASKSWVNFDGTGTVSIRESFNVSSITDDGTGDYTVNFATALVDANYATLASSIFGADRAALANSSAPQTTSVNVATASAGGFADSEYVSVLITR